MPLASIEGSGRVHVTILSTALAVGCKNRGNESRCVSAPLIAAVSLPLLGRPTHAKILARNRPLAYDVWQGEKIPQLIDFKDGRDGEI